MKQFIVNLLHNLGHSISKNDFLMEYEFAAGIYLWCMIKSSKLQDKWKLDKPWTKVTEDE